MGRRGASSSNESEVQAGGKQREGGCADAVLIEVYEATDSMPGGSAVTVAPSSRSPVMSAIPRADVADMEGAL